MKTLENFWALVVLVLIFTITAFTSCNSKKNNNSQPTAEEQQLLNLVEDATKGSIDGYSDGDIDSYHLSLQPIDTTISVSLTPAKNKDILLLTPEQELQLLFIKLEGNRFHHQLMPKFMLPLDNSANWNKYIHFVDSLFPTGVKPDCYFLEQDSMRFRVLSDDRKITNMYICLRNKINIYKDVVDGYTDSYVFSSGEFFENKIVMMIPQPEEILSRDIWDVVVDHELFHTKQLLGQYDSYVDVELLAYNSCFQVLRQKNISTYDLLAQYGSRFYKSYGFTNELRKLCSFLYRLDEVTYLERDLMEPALLLMVAMHAEKITCTAKDNPKFKKIMNALYAYLGSDKALAYK